MISLSFSSISLLSHIVSPDDVIASYDVKSLFTKIPPDLALKCLDEALSSTDSWKDKTALEKVDILELTEICLSSTVFQYDTKIYKQVHGTPMGSSISGPLAELVLQSIETKILRNNFDIKLWKRYVDDVIAIVPKTSCDAFFQFINSINVNIQFECEYEENNVIPFLDLQITRSSAGLLSFSVYRKPTNTDRYMDYQSNNPKSHKMSVIRALVDRAFNLCSTDDLLDSEISHIKQVLSKNGYRTSDINSVIARKRRQLRTTSNSDRRPRQTSNDMQYISAPYIDGTTEQLNRRLKKHNLTLASRTTKTLRNVFCKLKDKSEPMDKTDVIYKIDCNDCDEYYIGETNRNLNKRVGEHKKYL